MTFADTKDPQSVVDFAIDWTATLGESSPADVISTSTWTADFGLTIDSNSKTGAVTTVWVSGGNVRKHASLTNRIVTTAGRTHDRTITVKIQSR